MRPGGLLTTPISVIASWSQLFPPQVESAAIQAVVSLDQRLALIEIAFVIFIVLGIAGLVLVLDALLRISERVQVWVAKRTMSPRDWLIVAEAMNRLSDEGRQSIDLSGWLPEATILAVIVMLVGTYLAGTLGIAPLLIGVANAAMLGSLYLLGVRDQVLGFGTLKAPWAVQVRPHFANYVVSKNLASIVFLIGGFVLAAYLYIDVGLPVLTGWAEEKGEQAGDEFQQEILDSSADGDKQQSWQVWGRERVGGLWRMHAKSGWCGE